MKRQFLIVFNDGEAVLSETKLTIMDAIVDECINKGLPLESIVSISRATVKRVVTRKTLSTDVH